MDRKTKIDVLQKELPTRDETLLSDVLVWLDNIDYNWILNSNYILIRDNKKEFDDANIIEIRRDLTKPYLSEQSDEVVDGIYEVYLLTKKN